MLNIMNNVIIQHLNILYVPFLILVLEIEYS